MYKFASNTFYLGQAFMVDFFILDHAIQYQAPSKQH